jgi:hypothetical protein
MGTMPNLQPPNPSTFEKGSQTPSHPTHPTHPTHAIVEIPGCISTSEVGLPFCQIINLPNRPQNQYRLEAAQESSE